MLWSIGLFVAGIARHASAQTPVENDPYGTPNLVQNGNFTSGTDGWMIVPSGNLSNGMLCMNVPANTPANASYIKTAQSFTEVKNDVYYLNFTASASQPVNIWLQTQGEDPSAGGAAVDPNLNTTDCPLTASNQFFTFPYSPANQGDNATLTMFLGAATEATDICISNISLHRINRLPYFQDTGASIKVNQLGYLPNGPKMATVVTQASTPINWQLQNTQGAVAASGQTVPRGVDNSSRFNEHTIDFSSFAQEGDGYMLSTDDGATGYPFSIKAMLYDPLRKDSMQFFYTQRSGIAIDGGLVGAEYARAAGHLQVAPNQVCPFPLERLFC